MKWKIPWEAWRNSGLDLVRRYKFVLLVIAVGLVLLLWPSGEKPSETPPEATLPSITEDFSVSALEEKLSQTLSKVQGAGDVTVMLTVRGGARKILAEDVSTAVASDGERQSQRANLVVSSGAGAGEEPVLVQQLYPEFQGALVVCSGAGDASTRLKLMEAVSALTGLGADKISICKGKG